MNANIDKPLIYDLTLIEMENIIGEWGEPAYRAKQIWEGIYKNLWETPSDFTNLPTKLREKIAGKLIFESLIPDIVQDSKDDLTRKTLFNTRDGLKIEAVLMRYDKRNTLCISSQAGCALGCTFCATGQMGFQRNLSSGEIVEQVLHYARQLKSESKKVNNIVLMGMGEPFHNYNATLAAIDRLNQEEGFNLGARRFTISTVGIIPAIRKFTDERRQINLAISLHATDDNKRSSIIPINTKYPIKDLLEACREYVKKTGRRITIEWALIRGVNDSIKQAGKLADLLDGLNCHVNVIPLNPTPGFDGRRSTRESVGLFKESLENRGISCTVRVRRGIEIQAGCGQLANISS